MTMAPRIGNDDEVAIDELVSLAWERIRSHPCGRDGSMAANILLDVRKRYRRHRCIEVSTRSSSTVIPPTARLRPRTWCSADSSSVNWPKHRALA